MKFHCTTLFIIILTITSISLFAQDEENCFLYDFEPKRATIPIYEDVEKTTETPTVTFTIKTADTLGKVSKYVFGNAVAVWVGQDQNNRTLVDHLKKLAPTFIRFPGGSWSDIYFWNGNPGDLPNTIPDGTNNGQPIGLHPQYGPNYPLTFDRYLDMRDQVDCQGLITINYGYARYGLSERPAEQAAHLAAEWVRYDGGMTKFWEIGNENAGPWEAGWQIDTTLNNDGQPQIINGETYGRHFRLFADSMRAAAAELDETIYIGGQVLHYDGTGSWNVADRQWNEGFFREVGDAVDFYVMHNYFGNSTSSVKNQVNLARVEIQRNIDFIRQDISNKGAASRPIAITEYNIHVGGESDYEKRTSIGNAMQGVVLICEMIKRNMGLAARWLVANWESDGMFYFGPSSSIPLWNPRPAFYFLYYLQKFVGDHAINTAAVGSSNDVLTYATLFSSGEIGVIIMNIGTADQVVQLNPGSYGVGDRFYVYSLQGDDESVWPQGVFVNDEGPVSPAWGPLDYLEEIPARAYTIGSDIRLYCPERSVQYVMIEPGDNFIAVRDVSKPAVVEKFTLHQNYPNPFNARTIITYELPRSAEITLKIVDVTGREVATILEKKRQEQGIHTIAFDATNFPTGVYLYQLSGSDIIQTRKMLMIK